MLKASFHRTTTFRLALLYALLFCLSVIALFALIYWTADQLAANERRRIIEADLRSLEQVYRESGLVALGEAVLQRTDPEVVGDGVYVVLGPEDVPMAGNIRVWPNVETEDGSWISFPFARQAFGDPAPRVVEAYVLPLEGEFRLLVGRDTQVGFREAMIKAFAASLAVMLVLSGVAGLFMSRTVLRRIDALNDAADRIMQGEVKHRMPVRGRDDEFDRLAQHLNAMLDEIERLMGSIRAATNNIAHDLRSPLTRLRNRLESLLARPTASVRAQEELEQAIAEIDGLLQTFNALLSIADAEAGAGRGNLVPVDLEALVQDVAELYGPLVEDRGLAFESAIQGPATVLGNRQLLFQALGNLVDNAAKYGAGGGLVSLALTPAANGGGVAVSVADRGPGIPEADRGRVLDRFVRLDDSRSTPGNGLGLSLVAAIARLHNATLTLDDNRPGLKVTLAFKPAAP